MLKTLDEWPAGQAYITLQDFADNAISFTPLLRSYVDKVSVTRLDVAHYKALVMPQTFLAQFAKTFTRLRNKPGKFEMQIFFSRAEALAWLWDKLPEGVVLSKAYSTP